MQTLCFAAAIDSHLMTCGSLLAGACGELSLQRRVGGSTHGLRLELVLEILNLLGSLIGSLLRLFCTHLQHFHHASGRETRQGLAIFKRWPRVARSGVQPTSNCGSMGKHGKAGLAR